MTPPPLVVQASDREAACRFHGFDDEKDLVYWGNVSKHYEVERLAEAFAKHRIAALSRTRLSTTATAGSASVGAVTASPENAGNIVYRGDEWVPLAAYREAMAGWKAAIDAAEEDLERIATPTADTEAAIRQQLTDALSERHPAIPDGVMRDLVSTAMCSLGFTRLGRMHILPALALRQATPSSDGFVLVPREPTEKMIRAGMLGRQNSARSTAKDVWSFMIAAAPQVEGEGM